MDFLFSNWPQSFICRQFQGCIFKFTVKSKLMKKKWVPDSMNLATVGGGSEVLQVRCLLEGGKEWVKESVVTIWKPESDVAAV